MLRTQSSDSLQLSEPHPLHNISYKLQFAFTSPQAYLDGVTAALIGPELLPRMFSVQVTTACGRTAWTTCANVNRHSEGPSWLPPQDRWTQTGTSFCMDAFIMQAVQKRCSEISCCFPCGLIHLAIHTKFPSTQLLMHQHENAVPTQRGPVMLADYRNSSHQMEVTFFPLCHENIWLKALQPNHCTFVCSKQPKQWRGNKKVQSGFI